MHLGRNITDECLLTQLVRVFYQVLNAVQWWCCLKKMFNGEICHLKQTEKIVSLQVKCPIQIIVKFRTEKICAHFYQLGIIHQSSFERGTKYCHWGTKYCVAILCNGTNWKFIFPWRKIYWHVLQIVKRHFRRFS